MKDYNITELRKICKNIGISGCHRLSRNELVDVVSAAEYSLIVGALSRSEKRALKKEKRKAKKEKKKAKKERKLIKKQKREAKRAVKQQKKLLKEKRLKGEIFVGNVLCSFKEKKDSSLRINCSSDVPFRCEGLPQEVDTNYGTARVEGTMEEGLCTLKDLSVEGMRDPETTIDDIRQSISEALDELGIR